MVPGSCERENARRLGSKTGGSVLLFLLDDLFRGHGFLLIGFSSYDPPLVSYKAVSNLDHLMVSKKPFLEYNPLS